MFFDETNEEIHDNIINSNYLIEDILLSIDIINETYDTNFDFNEILTERKFIFMNNDEIKRNFGYDYDICLLNNVSYARYSILLEAKEYVDEWFRSYCS